MDIMLDPDDSMFALLSRSQELKRRMEREKEEVDTKQFQRLPRLSSEDEKTITNKLKAIFRFKKLFTQQISVERANSIGHKIVDTWNQIMEIDPFASKRNFKTLLVSEALACARRCSVILEKALVPEAEFEDLSDSASDYLTTDDVVDALEDAVIFPNPKHESNKLTMALADHSNVVWTSLHQHHCAGRVEEDLIGPNGYQLRLNGKPRKTFRVCHRLIQHSHATPAPHAFLCEDCVQNGRTQDLTMFMQTSTDIAEKHEFFDFFPAEADWDYYAEEGIEKEMLKFINTAWCDKICSYFNRPIFPSGWDPMNETWQFGITNTEWFWNSVKITSITNGDFIIATAVVRL